MSAGPPPLSAPSHPADTSTQDDTEAGRRYNRYCRFDPFPGIPAALLNSSDIYNYVNTTGMMCPFVEGQLKSSSYAIRIGNEIVYWDERETLFDKTLDTGESFTIPANSIVYIKSREKFRLPDYMAMRFNLKINNVHRGILLGTGPMVDPGFVGHLLIPLHNLTTNPYVFQESETFVWVEFTKTSPHARWDQAGSSDVAYLLPDKLKLFPDSKKDLTIWQYLNEAHKGPIRSSIPVAIGNAQIAAEDASAAARSARRWINGIGFGGILAFLVVMSTVFWNYINTVAPQFAAINRDLGKIDSFHSETTQSQESTQRAFNQLRDQISELRKSLSEQNIGYYTGRLLEIERRLIELEVKVQNSPGVVTPNRPR
jgi:deoxycytidine triphosphate deaminase